MSPLPAPARRAPKLDGSAPHARWTAASPALHPQVVGEGRVCACVQMHIPCVRWPLPPVLLPRVFFFDPPLSSLTPQVVGEGHRVCAQYTFPLFIYTSTVGGHSHLCRCPQTFLFDPPPSCPKEDPPVAKWNCVALAHNELGAGDFAQFHCTN